MKKEIKLFGAKNEGVEISTDFRLSHNADKKAFFEILEERGLAEKRVYRQSQSKRVYRPLAILFK